MKKINDTTYLTIGEVSKRIDRGIQTIKNWYEFHDKYYEKSQMSLPLMNRDLDAKGTRYFREDDIPQLEKFRDNIKYGMMSDVSRQKWGERGQKIADNAQD